MNARFKPKPFTKQEGQDNRVLAGQGAGVGNTLAHSVDDVQQAERPRDHRRHAVGRITALAFALFALPMLAIFAGAAAAQSYPGYTLCGGRDCLNGVPVTATLEFAGYWGDWTDFMGCPKGSYVATMDLRIEKKLSGAGDDDTALNAIKLRCKDYSSGQGVATVMPHNGHWGTWYGAPSCSDGAYSQAFSVWYETADNASHHGNDNYGMAFARNYCTLPTGGEEARFQSWSDTRDHRWSPFYVEKDNRKFEGKKLSCPAGDRIIGLQVRVEKSLGSGNQAGKDDTALNGVRIACAAFPPVQTTDGIAGVPFIEWTGVGGGTEVAAGADGSVWILGTFGPGNDKSVYKWNGSGFEKKNRAGVRIAVTNDGYPWVVDSANRIFHAQDKQGSSWTQAPGRAKDIGAGPGINSVFIIGTNDRVYKWAGSSGWKQASGSGKRIAVGPNGIPWIIGTNDAIYVANDAQASGWNRMVGKGRDIGVGADGSVWIIGNDYVDSAGYGIHRWRGGGWLKAPSAGNNISVLPDGKPWVTTLNNQIYRAATDGGSTTISLLSHHNRYVVAEPDGTMNANRTAVGAWEKFELITHSDGRVSFVSGHGKVASAQLDGTLVADRAWTGNYEKFDRIDNSDGTVSFRSYHGKYMVAEPDGNLNANRVQIGDYEKFRIIQPL